MLAMAIAMAVAVAVAVTELTCKVRNHDIALLWRCIDLSKLPQLDWGMMKLASWESLAKFVARTT